MKPQIQIKRRNIANENDVEDLKQKVLIREKSFEKSLSIILSTQEGVSVIARIIEWAGIYHQSFTGQANDTNFNEGRRSLGLKLLNYVAQVKPDVFVDLHRQATQIGEN